LFTVGSSYSRRLIFQEADDGKRGKLSPPSAPFYGYLKLIKATRKGKKSKQGCGVTGNRTRDLSHRRPRTNQLCHPLQSADCSGFFLVYILIPFYLVSYVRVLPFTFGSMTSVLMKNLLKGSLRKIKFIGLITWETLCQTAVK